MENEDPSQTLRQQFFSLIESAPNYMREITNFSQKIIQSKQYQAKHVVLAVNLVKQVLEDYSALPKKKLFALRFIKDTLILSSHSFYLFCVVRILPWMVEVFKQGDKSTDNGLKFLTQKISKTPNEPQVQTISKSILQLMSQILKWCGTNIKIHPYYKIKYFSAFKLYLDCFDKVKSLKITELTFYKIEDLQRYENQYLQQELNHENWFQLETQFIDLLLTNSICLPLDDPQKELSQILLQNIIQIGDSLWIRKILQIMKPLIQSPITGNQSILLLHQLMKVRQIQLCIGIRNQLLQVIGYYLLMMNKQNYSKTQNINLLDLCKYLFLWKLVTESLGAQTKAYDELFMKLKDQWVIASQTEYQKDYETISFIYKPILKITDVNNREKLSNFNIRESTKIWEGIRKLKYIKLVQQNQSQKYKQNQLMAQLQKQVQQIKMKNPSKMSNSHIDINNNNNKNELILQQLQHLSQNSQKKHKTKQISIPQKTQNRLKQIDNKKEDKEDNINIIINSQLHNKMNDNQGNNEDQDQEYIKFNNSLKSSQKNGIAKEKLHLNPNTMNIYTNKNNQQQLNLSNIKSKIPQNNVNVNFNSNNSLSSSRKSSNNKSQKLIRQKKQKASSLSINPNHNLSLKRINSDSNLGSIKSQSNKRKDKDNDKDMDMDNLYAYGDQFKSKPNIIKFQQSQQDYFERQSKNKTSRDINNSNDYNYDNNSNGNSNNIHSKLSDNHPFQQESKVIYFDQNFYSRTKDRNIDKNLSTKPCQKIKVLQTVKKPKFGFNRQNTTANQEDSFKTEDNQAYYKIKRSLNMKEYEEDQSEGKLNKVNKVNRVKGEQFCHSIIDQSSIIDVNPSVVSSDRLSNYSSVPSNFNDVCKVNAKAKVNNKAKNKNVDKKQPQNQNSNQMQMSIQKKSFQLQGVKFNKFPDKIKQLEIQIQKTKKQQTKIQQLMKEKDQIADKLKKSMPNDNKFFVQENQRLKKQLIAQTLIRNKQSQQPVNKKKQKKFTHTNLLHQPITKIYPIYSKPLSNNLKKMIISKKCLIQKNSIFQLGYAYKTDDKTICLYLKFLVEANQIWIRVWNNSLKVKQDLKTSLFNVVPNQQIKFSIKVTGFTLFQEEFQPPIFQIHPRVKQNRTMKSPNKVTEMTNSQKNVQAIQNFKIPCILYTFLAFKTPKSINTIKFTYATDWHECSQQFLQFQESYLINIFKSGYYQKKQSNNGNNNNKQPVQDGFLLQIDDCFRKQYEQKHTIFRIKKQKSKFYIQSNNIFQQDKYILKGLLSILQKNEKRKSHQRNNYSEIFLHKHPSIIEDAKNKVQQSLFFILFLQLNKFFILILYIQSMIDDR